VVTLDALRGALAGRYEILRELGAGGMATVYLARDLKLQRQVALKVLRPELAQSLGPERFLREIEIAAQLHHPHILALHDSGEADGFLYYVMPYVEGESLRDRIAREGELPVADAVRILRELVDALALAHSHNVVHRDIKPDNVMLSGRHALVMDFGIAKAVSEATGGGMVTTVGMALGTPAYMAPEQAAADPGVDHRADIYAVGATAYEMLTGRPPFTGRTQQELLAAQISKAPEPVGEIRSAVPPALAELVMRCLAKKPADRWQSAEAMLPVLEGLGTSSGGMTPTALQPASRRSLPRWLVPAAAVVAIVAVLGVTRFNKVGASGTLIGDEVLAQDDMLLVGEFINETEDSTLGETVTDATRLELQQSEVVRVIGQREMWDALRRMERDPGVVQPDSVVRELAEREGAKAYVTGTVRRLGSGYQLVARVVATADGAEVKSARATAADDSELIAAVEALGQELRTGIGESLRGVRATPGLARVTTSSLEALRTFVSAQRAMTAVRQVEGRDLLIRATELDTAFAAAWASLGSFYSNAGRYAEARAAWERAYLFRDRLGRVGQQAMLARYHQNRGEMTLAEAAWRQYVELGGNLNNLADFLMKQRRWAEAESLARIVRDDHPDSWVSHFNVIESQVAQRKFAAADSSMERLAAGVENAGAVHSMRLRLAWSQWHLDSVIALSESDPGSAARSTFNRCAVAVYRGRYGDADRCFGTLGPNTDGLLRRARVRMLGDTSGIGAAARELMAAVPELRSGQFALQIAGLAEAGLLSDAKRLLAEWRRRFGDDDPEYLRDRGLAEGAIALAEGRPDSAARAFLAYNQSGFITSIFDYGRGLPEAAMAYDRVGRADSAIVWYEAALAQPLFTSMTSGAVWYPIALRRLAELYEDRGDRDRAIAKYQDFIELWKDADPELQPQVAAARDRLAALVGEPGG
jgi:serine/threonine-protein kinase